MAGEDTSRQQLQQQAALASQGAGPGTSALRNISHGRGGAGNIANTKKDEGPSDPATTDDFTTPTIKSKTFTTGRGGTGNMAKNDKDRPEMARALQDVEGPPPREAKGEYHVGRGGAANRVKDESNTITTENGSPQQRPVNHRRSSSSNPNDESGVVGKAKGLVNAIRRGSDSKKRPNAAAIQNGASS